MATHHVSCELYELRALLHTHHSTLQVIDTPRAWKLPSPVPTPPRESSRAPSRGRNRQSTPLERARALRSRSSPPPDSDHYLCRAVSALGVLTLFIGALTVFITVH